MFREITIDTFTYVTTGAVPLKGFAMKGGYLYRDGTILGLVREAEDLAEPVFVGHSFAQMAVRGPTGPYRIAYDGAES